MSPIDICNMALALVGDRRISRLDEEAQASDPLARYCAEFYDMARTEVLATHRWTFAKDYVVLSRRADKTPFPGFSYVHALPTSLQRLLEIYPGSSLADESIRFSERKIDKFKIVGAFVHTNQFHVAAEYIQDVLDPDQWSPHFRPAVARLLAHYISGPVANDPSLAARHLEHYERVALPNAQFYDAVQDNSGENSDQSIRRAGSPLLQSRRDSDSAYGGFESDA